MVARHFLGVFAGSAFVAAVPTTIDNLAPRLDNQGHIMDSHDFSLRLYPDGYYYMTSVAYGGCKEPANLGCDQTPDHCGFQVRGWKFHRQRSAKLRNCALMLATSVAAEPHCQCMAQPHPSEWQLGVCRRGKPVGGLHAVTSLETRGSLNSTLQVLSPADRPAGTLYRPDAIWNPNTNQTVLWHNYVDPNGVQ
jgi:hypothetical protein